MKLFSRTDRSFLGQWWWTIDRGLLAAFLFLMIAGVVLVATASPPVAEHLGLGDFYFLKRHLVFLLPTAGILLGVSMLACRDIWRLAGFVFLAALAAMIAVLFSGAEIKGARRWLNLFGFSLQPSEFVKPAFVLLAAWLMALQKKNQNIPGNGIAAGLYFIVVILLLFQPDLGMTFLITGAWAAQILLAGAPLRLVSIAVLAGLAGLVISYFTFDHVQSRIDRFLFPTAGDNFQVEKSIEAFKTGGIFGKGPGQGTVKLHLPDAHADFIFAVAGEEFGLIFTGLLIAVFAFILFRGFSRLMASEDMYVLLAGGGLLAMFGLQTVIHMGSSLNILPAKGMTLPFISYGGSSLLAMGFAMGALLALTRRQVKPAGSQRSVFSLFFPRGSARKKL